MKIQAKLLLLAIAALMLPAVAFGLAEVKKEAIRLRISAAPLEELPATAVAVLKENSGDSAESESFHILFESIRTKINGNPAWAAKVIGAVATAYPTNIGRLSGVITNEPNPSAAAAMTAAAISSLDEAARAGQVTEQEAKQQRATLLSAGALPAVGASAPPTLMGTAFLCLVIVLQAAVFFGSCYLIYKLWSIVIAAGSGANDAKSKFLLSVLGGIDTSGSADAVGSKVGGRLKGTGLLGTLAILAFACIIIYLIGRHQMTGR